MANTAIGYLFASGFVLAAAAPFVCLFLWARSIKTGAKLPSGGAFAIYLGSLCWIVVIAGRSAVVESWRPWVAFPILPGLLLGLLWQQRADPAAGLGRAISNSGVFLVFGWLGWVALGGGYFDKMFQIPHAQKVLRKSGVKMDDAASLAGALRSDDVWVRRGAALTLGRMGPEAGAAIPTLLGLAEDPSPMVCVQALELLGLIGPSAKDAALPVLVRIAKSDKSAEVKDAASRIHKKLGISSSEWEQAHSAP